MAYSVSPSAFALDAASDPANNTYVLTLDSASSRDLDRLPGECAVLAGLAQSVVCTIDYHHQTTLREYSGAELHFHRDSVAQGQLTATLIADANNPELRETNPKATVEKELKSQLSVSMQAWSVGHADIPRYSVVAVHRQLGKQDPDLTVVASFDVPEGVVIESAEIESDFGFGYTNIVSRSCVVGDRVVCDLDDADNRFRFVHLKNNIVVGSESVFVADPVPDSTEQKPGSRIISSGNLLWNSGSTSLLPTEPTVQVRTTTETADVFTDPLFAAEGQARLSPWSPAIDAGVEPTSFESMLPLIRDYKGTLPGEIHLPHQPLDGLGDGDAIYDIGSHEYAMPD